METTTNILKEYTDEATLATCVLKLSSKINQNTLDFVDLVQELHSILTHDDPFERQRGVALLSGVLTKCDPKRISSQAGAVMLQFFTSRLDDQVSVGDLLKGILSLLHLDVLSKTDQLTISQSILTEVNVQSFPQPVRTTVFEIFAVLVKTTKISAEFIQAFIHIMDGEKDPRNLLLLFTLIPSLTKTSVFKPHVHDLFDIIFCYFPITFRPPPNDILGVTALQLKTALRDAITCTHHFAVFAIPVLLEKLSSTSASAKRDAIDTITESLEIYSATSYIPHLREIWTVLKGVVAVGEGSEVEALKCIRDMTKHLQNAASLSTDLISPLDGWLGYVITECMENMVGTETKYAKPCGKILMAVASASTVSCSVVVEQCVGKLLERYGNEEGSTGKKVVLDGVVDLLVAARLVNGTKTVGDQDMTSVSPFAEIQQSCIEIFVSVLLSNSYSLLKVTAITGIYQMIASVGLLSEADTELLLMNLDEVVVKGRDDVVVEAIKYLELLSIEQPGLIQSISVPFFFKNVEAGEEVGACLRGITTVSVNELIFNDVVGRLFLYLTEKKNDYNVVRLVVDALLVCFLKRESGDVVLAKQVEHIIGVLKNDELYGIIISCSLEPFLKLLNVVVRSLDSNAQMDLMHRVTDESAPVNFKNLLVYQALVCNSRPGTDIRAERFMVEIVNACISTESEQFLYACGTILGSILNKSKKSDLLLLSTFEQTFVKDMLNMGSTNPDVRKRLVLLYGWIGKGLVVRGHANGHQVMTFLLSLLDNPTLALSASRAIEIVIKDDALGYFSKSSFVVQKCSHFIKRVPELLTRYNYSTELDMQHHHLLSLAHLLRNISKKTLRDELPALMPMLLHSLHSLDVQLRCSTLDTFETVLEDAPQTIIENLKVLLEGVLGLTIVSEFCTPHVRVGALKLLGMFPGRIEFGYLEEYRGMVIRAVGLVLDDRKVVVRREAANTRCKWYLLVGQGA